VLIVKLTEALVVYQPIQLRQHVIETIEEIIDNNIDAEKAVKTSLRKVEREKNARKLSNGAAASWRQEISTVCLGLTVWQERLELLGGELLTKERRAKDLVALYYLDQCCNVFSAIQYVGLLRSMHLLLYIRRHLSYNESMQFAMSTSLLTQLKESLGKELALGFADISNKKGPIIVRSLLPNGMKPNTEHFNYQKVFGISGAYFLFKKKSNISIQSSDEFKLGHILIQSASSQCCVLAGRPKPGLEVLDACAGQGTKTLSLLSFGCKVTAYDIDEAKLRQCRGNAKRLGYDIDTFSFSTEPMSFDTVLVDAPCSSSGVLRRHPSLRSNLAIPKNQLSILEFYANYTSNILLYATCSVFFIENQHVARTFSLKHTAEFEPLPFDEKDNDFAWQPQQFRQAFSAYQSYHHPSRQQFLLNNELLFLPNIHGSAYDGFFIARWRRR